MPQACLRAGKDIFIDAHNAGYYINSYTTKVNPTMDNVLRRIMEGIRRLQAEWEDKDATQKQPQPSASSKDGDTGSADKEGERTSRQQVFRRALQTLNRLDTSFRKASWKSGCEMLFPILFGHMSFQTHRCWCVFMRRTIWLAAEAWRRYYGQAKTTSVGSSTVAPQFKLPTGTVITLPQGWRTERREDQEMYVDPDGTAYTAQELLPLALATFEEEGQGGVRGATLRVLQKSLGKLREGAAEEPDDQAPAQGDAATATRYHAYDQLDDWHHRGSHPILRNMNLYEYSRWVYRVEFSPFHIANAQVERARPRHIDISFDSNYALSTTWIQRLSREPRVPRVEGMRFESLANPEMHFLLKSVLLRPVHLSPEEQTAEPSPIKRLTREPAQLRLLRSYEALCTDGQDGQQVMQSAAGQGPFQRNYTAYKARVQALAAKAEQKRLLAADFPSLWDTKEVHQELRAAVARLAIAQGSAEVEPAEDTDLHQEQLLADTMDKRPTVDEHLAAEFLKLDRHFDGIAAAQTGRPKRQLEDDRNVVEEPLWREGAEDQAQGADALDERATLGLADLKQNLVIQHHFDAETVAKIIAFQMRDRFTRFTKELRSLTCLPDGALPVNPDTATLQETCRDLRRVLDTYEGNMTRGDGRGLASLDAEFLKSVVEDQGAAFDLKGAAQQEAVEIAQELPPIPASSQPAAAAPEACFVPSDRFRRPSDYIAHLCREFEAGNTTPPAKKKKQKRLKRDQTLFLTGFADACNKVWEDEQGDIPMASRRSFSFLLMGQGGSGKTAIVQEIVLPAIDFLFPPEAPGSSSSIIVCSSWAQAQNISTVKHKAVSCHNAAMMRVQSLRNAHMSPGEKKAALERKLGHKRLLVIEEVSMISPALYNMLLYRFYHGRQGLRHQRRDSSVPLIIHFCLFFWGAPVMLGFRCV